MVLWILPVLLCLRLRGSHPLRQAFPKPFCWLCRYFLQSEPQSARTLVWALPLSLAATHGIDVSFSSSGYLDVSVHRVPLHTLWIGVWIHGFTVWVSPFRYPWIVGYVLLPMAFRSLSRLSSALSAKASTLRSFLLNFAVLRYTRSVHIPSSGLFFQPCLLNLQALFPQPSGCFWICFFDVLLIIMAYYFFSLCMKFSRYMDGSFFLPYCCFPQPVELRGFEPLTPCLQGRCSPN